MLGAASSNNLGRVLRLQQATRTLRFKVIALVIKSCVAVLHFMPLLILSVCLIALVVISASFVYLFISADCGPVRSRRQWYYSFRFLLEDMSQFQHDGEQGNRDDFNFSQSQGVENFVLSTDSQAASTSRSAGLSNLLNGRSQGAFRAPNLLFGRRLDAPVGVHLPAGSVAGPGHSASMPMKFDAAHGNLMPQVPVPAAATPQVGDAEQRQPSESGKSKTPRLKWEDWNTITLIEVKRAEHIEDSDKSSRDRCERSDAKWVKIARKMNLRLVEGEG
ncbi:hypothetical protein R1sor_019413 [Riccia sorocarpa]|uniref:Uncharacterized protein n=1 Tax=Riccia sorocarpa TaxID=122646 RepID=A0ABD3ID19_9MARC